MHDNTRTWAPQHCNGCRGLLAEARQNHNTVAVKAQGSAVLMRLCPLVLSCSYLQLCTCGARTARPLPILCVLRTAGMEGLLFIDAWVGVGAPREC